MGKRLTEVRAGVARSGSEAARFLREGKLFFQWIFAAALILAVFWAFPAELASRVRWCGTFFEFLGVGAVVLGVNRARVSFGKPSVWQLPLIWISSARFIFIKRPAITLSAHAMLGGVSGMAALGTMYVKPVTIEERVARLETQMEETNTKVENVRVELDKQVSAINAELQKERDEREKADKQVNQRLEEGMIGDSHLEIAGVCFLVLGLVMGNLAGEVADGLKLLGIK